jgi:O-antigen chain-terminating methyltransferase
LGDVRRPLYVCSDAQAWVGDRWFQFERVCERSHAGVPDAFAGERRFLFGRNEIVKAYRGEGPYGAFNRAELNAEAAALAVLAGEPDRYPEVSGRSDDGDAVWLARGRLPGRLLSEYFDDDRRIDRAVVVRGLLDELAHLESRGFHHGDLRCWNVLVDEDRVRLIDFGALTREPSPLHRIALAAILLEIAEGKLRHHQPFYATLHPLSAYPAAWRNLVRYLLETPQRTFHFARAAESLGEEVARRGHGPDTRLAPATDVMVAAAQEQVEGFRRLQGHLEETERRLVAASGEFAAAAAERALLERGRGVAEAHALSLAKALSESQHYAESLRQSLDQSTDFADSLQARILRETADARAERETFAVSQRDAAAHAATLEQSLRESRAYADSLKEALAGSRLHAESLQARILRETADIRAEREAVQVSQREAAVHAATLEQSLGESQAYANSLKEALEGSQQYAASLQARLAREATDALAERQAWQISQRDAAAHAAALGQALGESRAYADSLKEALESSHLYAGSLQQRLEREAGDASRERAKLMADLARWQARHARMQYRFRLLKFLWPHEDPKEPE